VRRDGCWETTNDELLEFGHPLWVCIELAKRHTLYVCPRARAGDLKGCELGTTLEEGDVAFVSQFICALQREFLEAGTCTSEPDDCIRGNISGSVVRVVAHVTVDKGKICEFGGDAGTDGYCIIDVLAGTVLDEETCE
jgi:hypothetical protein